MPWTPYAKQPDDAIHDWLRSQYTPYRNALAEPTVLPEESKINWDTTWVGIFETSFDVLEDMTIHNNRGLGIHTIDFDGVFFAKVTMKWVKSAKPPKMGHFREFLTKVLHSNVNPIPTTLRTEAGIWQMVPINSRVYQFPPENAQADFWILEMRIATRVQNSII